jgi:succinylglutamate desuccinylase
MNTLPNNIFCFTQNKPGPTVTIMGASHGDERIGAKIVEQLKQELVNEEIHGTIYLVIGNPEALEANVRYLEHDLNRLFGKNFHDLLHIEESKMSGEQKRALEISSVLRKSNYLLDIHATIKPSIPFIYCENSSEHLSLAPLFQTQFAVSADNSIARDDLTSSADNFVDQHGGLAFTYESGWNKDLSHFKEVLTNTKRFLQFLGVSFFLVPKPTSKMFTHILIYDDVIPKTLQFEFEDDFSNFHFIKAGEVIAKDGETIIKAKKDSYIVFPKKNIQKNQVACYLAYRKN